jgi:monofunctional biosynthetic peptidoglycan transglycosylase
VNKFKSIILKLWAYIKSKFWDIVVLFIVITVSWVLLYRFVPVPITYLMVQRSITDEGSLSYEWVDWNRISPAIKVCAMASEDQSLPFHYGLDFSMIENAMETNSKRKRKKFGASTITQQVAKNAFLFPQRSYIRKGLELYFAFLIETLWPKERILEVYLNIAEMGDLTFGVQSASKRFFGKPASQLNLQQSATIIACLPNPRKFDVKRPSGYIQKRANEIVSLYRQLDGTNYLRELYVKSDQSLYNFNKYRK